MGLNRLYNLPTFTYPNILCSNKYQIIHIIQYPLSMINTSINNRSHMEDITNPLQNYIMKFVQITTNDGRVFIGILKGIDDTLNAILISTVERIFSETQPPKEIDLGIYFIRGDTILCVGEIDEQLESQRNLAEARGVSLKLTHTT